MSDVEVKYKGFYCDKCKVSFRSKENEKPNYCFGGMKYFLCSKCFRDLAKETKRLKKYTTSIDPDTNIESITFNDNYLEEFLKNSTIED